MLIADLALNGQIVLLPGGRVGEMADGSFLDPDFEVFSDDESDIRIEEAVIALARAVFARGGQLAVQDDPVVTPLAVEVALEYWQSLPSEGRIDELEGRRFSDTPVPTVGSETTFENLDEFEFATQIGCARGISTEVLSQMPFFRIVCVGGGGDVSEQLSRLEALGKFLSPVFAISSTGGAASIIAHERGVRDPERGIAELIATRRKQLHFAPPEQDILSADERLQSRVSWEGQVFEDERIQDFRYALYPIVMSVILDSEPEVLGEAGGFTPQET